MFSLYLMLVFVVVAAIFAIENHNLLSSVISVSAVGFGLCILFLQLGAPELAVTQLVVEIIILVVLIRVTLTKAIPESYRGRELLAYIVAAVFIPAFLFFSFPILRNLPQFGQVPPEGISNNTIAEIIKVGAKNLVSAVALDVRALDSFISAAVLLAMAFGVLVILRTKGEED